MNVDFAAPVGYVPPEARRKETVAEEEPAPMVVDADHFAVFAGEVTTLLSLDI